MKYFILLCAVCLCGIAQPQVVVNTIENRSFIGLEQVSDGFILFFGTQKGKDIEIVKLSNTGETEWQTKTALCRSGQSINQITILEAEKKLWLLNINEQINFTLFSKTGEILQKEKTVLGLEDHQYNDAYRYIAVKDAVYFVSDHANELEVLKLNNDKSEFGHFSHLSDESELKLRFSHFRDHTVVAYSTLTNKGHDEMQIKWQTFDLNGEIVSKRRSLIESDTSSFRYYSQGHSSFFESMVHDSGFLSIGKLYFNENESSSLERNEQTTGALTGFWVSRHEKDGSLKSFDEYLFKDQYDHISSGLFKWDRIVDAKIDNQGGLFVNFTKLGGILASSHVIYHLSSSGEVLHVESAEIPSGILDYSNKGIRHLAKKYKTRVAKDEWRYYSVNYLPYLTPTISMIQAPILLIQKRLGRNVLREDVAFNFFRTTNSGGLVFEYSKTSPKRGDLKVFQFISSNFEF